VAAVLCGAAGRVPPIAGLREADPITRPLRLAERSVETPGEVVLVNSIASGGTVVSIVLRVPRAS
jgi:3-oxoacyl-(acyl-carrier-protein) synthase